MHVNGSKVVIEDGALSEEGLCVSWQCLSSLLVCPFLQDLHGLPKHTMVDEMEEVQPYHILSLFVELFILSDVVRHPRTTIVKTYDAILSFFTCIPNCRYSCMVL